MKRNAAFCTILLALGFWCNVNAQNTLFNMKGPQASGGYIAATNKFTNIDGKFANIVQAYGGWYINHKVLFGVNVATSTNPIPVDYWNSTDPGMNQSYKYSHIGLMTEYVASSNRRVHLVFQMAASAAFTIQTNPYNIGYFNSNVSSSHNEDWFMVIEPGVQIEVNVLKWLRVSPGVSFRHTYGVQGRGLTDDNLTDAAFGLTLKGGWF